ncbi:MAG: response regulator [Candidatus Omnitrophota bacterium]|nr:response regulator [Candidatus Omnitrophota bacterium]MDZ4243068.1 response regulator [Candidatus Omnitrophota bacterium]
MLKILVADDEPDVLAAMVKKLSLEGFETVSAADGEEAWAKIGSENPDIVLLDLNMPKMDGFTVLRNLREHPPSDKWQPVIIISGRVELDDMKQGFSLEADHYLTKPCSMADVLKAVRLMINLLPQRKTRQDLEREKA